jgi:hypothetical protein
MPAIARKDAADAEGDQQQGRKPEPQAGATARLRRCREHASGADHRRHLRLILIVERGKSHGHERRRHRMILGRGGRADETALGGSSMSSAAASAASSSARSDVRLASSQQFPRHDGHTRREHE